MNQTDKAVQGHTLGPWEIDIDASEISTCIVDVVKCATQEYSRQEFKPVDYANARLIAAAPDLLEALEACVGAMYAVTSISADRAKEQARAAIARAKGESA